jgi:hypothetical protein
MKLIQEIEKERLANLFGRKTRRSSMANKYNSGIYMEEEKNIQLVI